MLALVRSLRPHQWSKNLLLLLPLLLAHEVADLHKWTMLGLALVALSACASAGYLFNDLLDLRADRRHARKRHRPLASGQLGVRTAIVTLAALLAAGFGLSAACISWPFTNLLALYVVGTALYSLHLKRVLFLDILVLAGLYTLRILAGGLDRKSVV